MPLLSTVKLSDVIPGADIRYVAFLWVGDGRDTGRRKKMTDAKNGRLSLPFSGSEHRASR
jgi:hypothetical protein